MKVKTITNLKENRQTNINNVQVKSAKKKVYKNLDFQEKLLNSFYDHLKNLENLVIKKERRLKHQFLDEFLILEQEIENLNNLLKDNKANIKNLVTLAKDNAGKQNEPKR